MLVDICRYAEAELAVDWQLLHAALQLTASHDSPRTSAATATTATANPIQRLDAPAVVGCDATRNCESTCAAQPRGDSRAGSEKHSKCCVEESWGECWANFESRVSHGSTSSGSGRPKEELQALVHLLQDLLASKSEAIAGAAAAATAETAPAGKNLVNCVRYIEDTAHQGINGVYVELSRVLRYHNACSRSSGGSRFSVDASSTSTSATESSDHLSPTAAPEQASAVARVTDTAPLLFVLIEDSHCVASGQPWFSPSVRQHQVADASTFRLLRRYRQDVAKQPPALLLLLQQQRGQEKGDTHRPDSTFPVKAYKLQRTAMRSSVRQFVFSAALAGMPSASVIAVESLRRTDTINHHAQTVLVDFNRW